MRRLSKMPADANRPAALTVRLANAGQSEPDDALLQRDAVTQYLATIGQRGGIKGGKARAEALSPKRRREIARKAAQARWQTGKK